MSIVNGKCEFCNTELRSTIDSKTLKKNHLYIKIGAVALMTSKQNLAIKLQEALFCNGTCLLLHLDDLICKQVDDPVLKALLRELL